jgi:hypothetical protein
VACTSSPDQRHDPAVHDRPGDRTELVRVAVPVEHGLQDVRLFVLPPAK